MADPSPVTTNGQALALRAMTGAPATPAASPRPRPSPPWRSVIRSWPRRCGRTLCGCGLCGACVRTRIRPINRILPVTFHPNECDFLEIRPRRRIRVIHRYGVLVDSEFTDGGAGPPASDSESEEEDYWFEHAAPRRPPIQPDPPPAGPANRIFNKFEPQAPPRIPGIQPPSLRHHSGGPTAGRSPGSPVHRLARKVILPTSDLDFDDDDDELAAIAEAIEEQESERRPRPEVHAASPVMEENFVSNVLADMNGLIMSITADSTESRPSSTHPTPVAHSPEPPDRSPTPQGAPTVKSQPDPESEHSDVSPSDIKIIVDGGFMGGHANVAFEEEDEGSDDEIESPLPTSQVSHSAREPESRPARVSLTHETDAGYRRVRNLSLALNLAGDESAVPLTSDEDSSDSEPSTPVQAHDDDVAPLPRPTARNNETHLATPVCMNPNPVGPAMPNGDHALNSSGVSPPLRPVIFLIHGVGGSASTWSNQVKYFTARGYEVIVPDLLGHGFSSVPDNPKSYTFNKLFRDLITIFDHYIPDGRQSVIIAHSYGCSFASAIARIRPTNVVLLLLIACGGPTPLIPPKVFKTLPTVFIGCFKPFLKCGFLRQRQYNPRGRQIKFQKAFDVPSYVFKHIMAGQHWPEGDVTFHRRISVPSLLVYGMKDPFVSLVEMCEMERTMPKAYLELVPLAGHMVMLEQPKQLNTMMRIFIEKYYPPPPSGGS